MTPQKAPRGGRTVLAYGRDAADVAFISDYGAQPLTVSEMTVQVSAVTAQTSHPDSSG